MKPKLQAEIIIEKFNYGDKIIANQCAITYVDGMIDEAILNQKAEPSSQHSNERLRFWRDVRKEI